MKSYEGKINAINKKLDKIAAFRALGDVPGFIHLSDDPTKVDNYRTFASVEDAITRWGSAVIRHTKGYLGVSPDDWGNAPTGARPDITEFKLEQGGI